MKSRTPRKRIQQPTKRLDCYITEPDCYLLISPKKKRKKPYVLVPQPFPFIETDSTQCSTNIIDICSESSDNSEDYFSDFVLDPQLLHPDEIGWLHSGMLGSFYITCEYQNTMQNWMKQMKQMKELLDELMLPIMVIKWEIEHWKPIDPHDHFNFDPFDGYPEIQEPLYDYDRIKFKKRLQR